MNIPIDGKSAVGKARRRMNRPSKEPHRPWMLGTDDIPPPMDVPWQMWSASSNPYEQGLVQFEFTPKGLQVRWWMQEATVIEWHELAIIAGQPPRLMEEVQFIKEQAHAEGYWTGLAMAIAKYELKAEQLPQRFQLMMPRNNSASTEKPE